MFETLNASAAGTSCALGVGGRSLLKNGVEPGLDSTSLLKAEVFRGDGLGRLGERIGKSGVVVSSRSGLFRSVGANNPKIIPIGSFDFTSCRLMI